MFSEGSKIGVTRRQKHDKKQGIQSAPNGWWLG